MPGALVLSGAARGQPPDTGGAAYTDASGYYTLTNVITGTYTLTPTLSGYTFSPTVRMVSVPPNQIGQDFVGTSKKFVFLPVVLNNHDIVGRRAITTSCAH